MRSRSPLWCIQPCRRTTAPTMYLASYSKPLLASTLLKAKNGSVMLRGRIDRYFQGIRLLIMAWQTDTCAIPVGLCYSSP